MSAPTLRIGIVKIGKNTQFELCLAQLRLMLDLADTTELTDLTALETGAEFDLVVALGVCGSTPLSAVLARRRIPCLAMEAYLGFHPYHAAFYRAVEAGNGIVLPANDPEEIADSLAAVRARKGLQGTRLLVVDTHDEDFRAEEIATFARGCRETLGVEIIRRPVSELQERAKGVSDEDADAELARWYREILDGPSEMDDAHMRQVARLFIIERAMLEETGATGITVEDIGGFLLQPERHIMPNVTYGPLVFAGFLAAEEGDIEVLTTELLLRAGLDAHPTMSNLYLGFRDQFDTIAEMKKYTPEMQLEDYRQCVADNHFTASHFRAFGVLPPNMMTEDRYRVREAWTGQSMVVATPRLGPVMLARLTTDAHGLHLVPGEADALKIGDEYNWHRCRWFIQVPDMRDFINRCQHQHYVIGPKNDRERVLRVLTEKLLGLTIV